MPTLVLCRVPALPITLWVPCLPSLDFDFHRDGQASRTPHSHPRHPCPGPTPQSKVSLRLDMSLSGALFTPLVFQHPRPSRPCHPTCVLAPHARLLPLSGRLPHPLRFDIMLPGHPSAWGFSDPAQALTSHTGPSPTWTSTLLSLCHSFRTR